MRKRAERGDEGAHPQTDDLQITGGWAAAVGNVGKRGRQYVANIRQTKERDRIFRLVVLYPDFATL